MLLIIHSPYVDMSKIGTVPFTREISPSPNVKPVFNFFLLEEIYNLMDVPITFNDLTF
jgi:hypothetical protein